MIVDRFGRRLIIIERDLHIYRRLDIALFMNRRILTKYDKNLYLDSGLICENRTLRFPKLEPPVLQLEHFQNAIASLSELQIMHSIYPF
jgi:hypothetical protein